MAERDELAELIARYTRTDGEHPTALSRRSGCRGGGVRLFGNPTARDIARLKGEPSEARGGSSAPVVA